MVEKTKSRQQDLTDRKFQSFIGYLQRTVFLLLNVLDLPNR